MRNLFWNWNRKAQVTTLGLALVLVVMTGNTAIARIRPGFDYKKLFKESDVVVIATVVSTDNTDDKFPLPGQEDDFQGQNTTFEIQKVVQGDVDGEQLQLLHFKYIGHPVMNGPCLVNFQTTLEAGGFKMSEAEYMLFLKRTRDGRYVPVSGQLDSEDSVKILSPPGINRQKEKQEKKKK